MGQTNVSQERLKPKERRMESRESKSLASVNPMQERRFSRRALMQAMAVGTGIFAVGGLAACTVAPVPSQGSGEQPIISGQTADEIVVMWHDLGASDAQVW